MKTATVVTIICWTLIALVLIGVPIIGLTGGIVIGGVRYLANDFFGLNLGGSNAAFSSSVSETGTEQLSATGIEKVYIEWIDGQVELVYYDGSDIKLEQKCITSIPDNKKLRFSSNGNELHIYEGAMSVQWGFNLPSTSLTMYIPKTLTSLTKLDISSVSGEVIVCAIYADKLEVNTTSGGIYLNGTCGNEADLESTSGAVKATASTFVSVEVEEVSGAVYFEGTVNMFEAESVSGAVVLKDTVCPNKVKANTVSGAIQLMIPDDTGFTASLESVSGNASCSFPVTMSGKNHMVYLNGGAVFECSSVSGGLSISKID